MINLHFLTACSRLVWSIALISTSYMVSEHPRKIGDFLVSVYTALYGFVFAFFEGINHRIGSDLSVRRMERETSEHVHVLCTMLCLVIPASLLYVLADFYILRENALDSVLWGLVILFYSNFLPDLPSIYRRKNAGDAENLAWYKKYSLLLCAPLLIWAFYSGVKLSWKTSETFHNFRSLAVYGAFLVLMGVFAFGDIPITFGDITKIVSLPLYGLTGYLAHLKVDKIW